MQDALFFPIRQGGGKSAMSLQSEGLNRDNEMDNLLAKIDSIIEASKAIHCKLPKKNGREKLRQRQCFILKSTTNFYRNLPQFFYRHHLSNKTANP